MSEGLTNEQITVKIQAAIRAGRLRFRVSSQSWVLGTKPVSVKRLARVLANRMGVSNNRVHDALEDVALQEGEDALLKLQAAILLTDKETADDTELRKWLRLMEREGTCAQTHEANVFVCKQWIWQIKQGVQEKDVRYHVAPIFWSKEQGTGKSYNVKTLFKPVRDYTRDLTVDDLNDKFNASLFQNSFVVFFDEFVGADKVCAGMLKAIMSGKRFDQRGMHSEMGHSVENRLSMVATSNEDPPHGLNDPTGARRLWSVHCHGTPMQANEARAQALDKIDAAAIWACVRSNDPCPHDTVSRKLLAFMDEIREERLRSKSALESFVEDGCERDAEAPRMLLKDFRSAANTYAAETKQAPFRGGYGKYAEKLRTLQIQVVNPQRTWYVCGVRLKQFDSPG